MIADIQVLKKIQVFYYTQPHIDEYYLSYSRTIKGEFIGSGLEDFGIKDTTITGDDKRFKYLMNGYDVTGENELRRGLGQTKTYRWLENSQGEKLTIERIIYLSKGEVEAIQSKNIAGYSKRLKELNKDIDSSWLVKKGKKSMLLVDPKTKEKVTYRKTYSPSERECEILSQETFTDYDYKRLDGTTRRILEENNIKDPQAALKTKKFNSRPGYDITFSAPKSVSVLWALENDSEKKELIYQAHIGAVKDAASFIEQFFFTRTGKDGINQEDVKLVMAMIPHFTSRECDPQLHAHLVTPNIGKREDGSYGAIDAELVFAMKFATGSLYRSTLANNLQQLGYGLNHRNFTTEFKTIKVPFKIRMQGEEAKNAYITKRLEAQSEKLKNYGSTFGVKGISQELEQQFSKRAAQINAKCSSDDSYDKKRAAKFGTRKKKEFKANIEEQKARWEKEALELGFEKTPDTCDSNKVELSNERLRAIHRDTVKQLVYQQENNGISLSQIYTALERTSKGQLTAALFVDTANHIQSNYLNEHEIKKKIRYTVNERGITVANYLSNREKAILLQKKGSRAISFLKYNSVKNKALILLLTGRISHKNYSDFLKGEQPKSALSAKLMYATFRISKKSMKYHLKRLEFEEKDKQIKLSLSSFNSNKSEKDLSEVKFVKVPDLDPKKRNTIMLY